MKFKLFLILWFIVCSGALTGCDRDKMWCMREAMKEVKTNEALIVGLTYDQAKEVCGVGR